MVPCSFNLPREAIFFFKFPYWLKEHFRGLKSISLFTEAIKTSLQLFPVAPALKQEHSGTSNYSFEEHSLSSRARHFPSHSLKFRQPGHCRWQVSQNQTIQWKASEPASRTLWAGFRVTGASSHFPRPFFRLNLQGPQSWQSAGDMLPTFPFSELLCLCSTAVIPSPQVYSTETIIAGISSASPTLISGPKWC